MKVAFIHYHLKPGGVTTVLRHQLEVLAEGGEGLVLSGSPPAGPIGAPVVTIPALAYDSQGGGGDPAEVVADAVAAAIHAHWLRGCDLLHVHNPLLAKNRRLPAVLEALQRRGVRLLLQVHDFAEDGRPQHYTRQPYPADCHYAVVNSRDYRFLKRAGLRERGLHLLPNMIAAPPAPAGPPVDTAHPRCSTRCGPSGAKTSAKPPCSPAISRATAAWRSPSRPTATGTARCMPTGRPFPSPDGVKGGLRRGAPPGFRQPDGRGTLHPDHQHHGRVRFFLPGALGGGQTGLGAAPAGNLPGLRGPGGFPSGTFTAAWTCPWRGSTPRPSKPAGARASGSVCCSLGLAPDPAEVQAAFDHITRENRVDFGLLDEGAQQRVIARVHAERKAAQRLAATNTFLQDPGRVPDAPELVRRNRAAVLASYNRAEFTATNSWTPTGASSERRCASGWTRRCFWPLFWTLKPSVC